MPRNPDNKRVEILLTPEQYDALVHWAKVYRMVDESIPEGTAAVAEAIRALLTRAIPEFAKAKPLLRRGQYEREPVHEETSD